MLHYSSLPPLYIIYTPLKKPPVPLAASYCLRESSLNTRTMSKIGSIKGAKKDNTEKTILRIRIKIRPISNKTNQTGIR